MLRRTANCFKKCWGIPTSPKSAFIRMKKEKEEEEETKIGGYEVEFEPLPELQKSS